VGNGKNCETVVTQDVFLERHFAAADRSDAALTFNKICLSI
jgi:hypothetical protein